MDQMVKTRKLDNNSSYEKLYVNWPDTALGRAHRAALLLRKGWGRSRAFDDCFEMGDGDQVLARLMQAIRTHSPELRQMMQAQGIWCDTFEDILSPDQFADPSDRQLPLF